MERVLPSNMELTELTEQMVVMVRMELMAKMELTVKMALMVLTV